MICAVGLWLRRLADDAAAALEIRLQGGSVGLAVDAVVSKVGGGARDGDFTVDLCGAVELDCPRCTMYRSVKGTR